MPSPPWARSSERSAWRNSSKTLGKHVGGDADAVVAHAEGQGPALVLDGGTEPDLPPFAGVLHGVVQEVAEDLLQPRRVGVQEHRGLGRWERDGQIVALGRDQRLDALDGVGDERLRRDQLAAEHDLAPGDPRDVEQVVDEPGHVPDLPAHELDRPVEVSLALVLLGVPLAEHLECVIDGGQGVAQLVGEHRQELVLLAVGPGELLGPLSQLAFQPPPLLDVVEDQDDAADRGAVAADRGRRVVDGDLRPVPGNQHALVRQADDSPFAEDLGDRALDRPARFFVDQGEDLVERPAQRFLLGPAGQRLGDRVHEHHGAAGVGDDHGVADAGQRHAEPLALLE